jgi:hypothetical protein
MALWRLKPIDLADPNWEASTYRGIAIVRARNEDAARKAAQDAFGVKTRFPTRGGLAAPPWKRPGLVAIEIAEDTRYDPEGPTEVLYPSKA